jgi:hypothetical protein
MARAAMTRSACWVKVATGGAAPTVVPPVPSQAPPPGILPSEFLPAALERLVASKLLPKFQFERAIGGFLGPFLPEIFALLLNWEVDLVAPEFPIRKAANNQSTNVDELLYRRGPTPHDERWVFLELKTASRSVSRPQLAVYKDALTRGMPSLLADLVKIERVTTAKAKYRELRHLVGRYPPNRPLDLVYLAPESVDLATFGLPSAQCLTFSQLASLQLQRYASEWKCFRDTVLPALNAG